MRGSRSLNFNAGAMSVAEVWKLSQKSDQMWGIGNYEVPAKYFDHLKSVQGKEWMEFNSGKKKRAKAPINKDAKRNLFTEKLEKKYRETPEPWRYDLPPVWARGSKDDALLIPAAKSMQACRFKWMSMPADKQVIQEKPKGGRGKPDMAANKHTFIDQIISQNLRPNYPSPGPQNYFMDEAAVKRLCPDKADLVLRKNGDQKPSKDTFP